MVDAVEVKRRFSAEGVLAYAERQGLKRKGNRFQCPARCSEDARGCSVNDTADGAMWKCQRDDSHRGSIIDLVQHVRGLDFSEALMELGDEIPPPPKPRRPVTVRDEPAIWGRLAGTDEQGARYLDGRGLGGAIERELVRFSVGASGDAWVDGKAYEGYRLAVPLRDTGGAVRAFQLRGVRDTIPAKKAKLWLPGEKPKGISFGMPLEAFSAAPVVFVTEGIADTLAVQLADVVVIGAPGVDQLKHLPAVLGDVKGRVIVGCPQNDAEHGKSEKAFKQLLEELQQAGARVRLLVTPVPFKDPSEWRQSEPDAFAAGVVAAPLSAELDFVKRARLASDPLPEGLRPFTDLGNAETLVDLHGQDIRYTPPAKRWNIWNGKCWAPDQTDEIMRRSMKTARHLYQLSQDMKKDPGADPEIREKLAKHARKSEGAPDLTRCIKLTQAQPGVPVLSGDFDADPYLFCCNNGTLDLRTGELREHRRADMISRISSVDYRSDAKCPTFDLFMLAIMRGDAEMVDYLQRLYGYGLSGLTNEQVLHIFHGEGGNGKGTLRNVTRAVLGPYGYEMSMDVFLERQFINSAAPRPDLIALAGPRLITATENNEGDRLEESLIKRLSGGDPISARQLHAEVQELKIQAKFIMSVNHKPQIRHLDQAMIRRLRFIPFEAKFEGADRDYRLEEKLLVELPGILAWMVRGALAYVQRGTLEPPASITAATREYLREQDPVAEFLSDTTQVVIDSTDRDARVPTKILFERFEMWVSGKGITGRKWTENWFARELGKKHVLGERTVGPFEAKSDGTKHWRLGLRLQDSDRPAQQQRFPGDD